MTILLDNNPFDTGSLPPTATVSDVLAVAKERLEGSGRVVVGLREGGKDVPADHLPRVCSQPLGDFAELQVVTGRPKQVVLDALEQVRGAFVDTFAQVREAADCLAGGEISATMAKLTGCVQVWGQTHGSIVQGGVLLGVKFDDLRIGDRPIAECLTSLTERLRDLKRAIESRDHVLLGDLLRYELDATLQEWEAMVDGFIAHVQGLDDPG